jgi:CelD/BcsL family acetyltransferase involved in cellulose biosynthesis
MSAHATRSTERAVVRRLSTLRLKRLDPSAIDWQQLDLFPDRVVFQTREWLDFIAQTQRAEPVLAAVLDDGRTVGYFTGLLIRRYGVRILGSPFPGWTTASMGFNLEPGTSRREAVEALVDFAFGPLRCLHLELKDRRLNAGDLDGLGFASSPTLTYEIDLAADEEEIFARMKSACRRAIRKSAKEVVVERATGLDFADEYYAQLEEVFAKQSLRPTYGVSRVRELIRCLEPTGRLLLLRARAPDGQSIATAIFVAMNGVAYFWGGASWRRHQILRPNEAIFWDAIRFWKGQGMTVLDLGGGGDYKLKYGPRELHLPFFRKSRFRALLLLREGARRTVELRQRRREGVTEPRPAPETDSTLETPVTGTRDS